MNTGTAVNASVVNRQRPPGPTSGSAQTGYSVRGPKLVGKPPRDPGKNEPALPFLPGNNQDGTDYEDMLFGDRPAKSAPLRNAFPFFESDKELESIGRDLMTATSIGDLETVALECWDRFCAGTGGTYSNTKLTDAVRNHDKTFEFTRAFEAKLRKAILACKCDLRNFTPLPIGRYTFDSLADKAGGLGIIIHDIWTIKAELKDYNGSWDNARQTGAFYAKIVYTLTDDFGLDWHDIEAHGEDSIPISASLDAGDGFKAWYILQHYRRAVPFFVEIKFEYIFDDDARRPF